MISHLDFGFACIYSSHSTFAQDSAKDSWAPCEVVHVGWHIGAENSSFLLRLLARGGFWSIGRHTPCGAAYLGVWNGRNI